jgi:hypothetical protein
MSDVANEASQTSNELTGFHQFIGERLSKGDGDLSPEEALDIWRSEHPLPDDYDDTVAALREAFEEMDAGVPGIPAKQFFREFRERHGLPPES